MLQTTLVTFLQGGTVSPFCSDGRQRQQCPMNRCMVPPDVPPVCGQGQLCITDGCADCSTVCTPMPPSNADASAALQLLKSWLDLLRSDDGETACRKNMLQCYRKVHAWCCILTS